MNGVQFSVEEAARVMGGAVLQVGAGAFAGAVIDSRAVAPGCAFVAIRGEHQDGHAFCQAASEAGASVLIVSEPPPASLPSTTAVIRVEDTRLALGRLAMAWRQRVNPTVAAITGSVGKTTTKELLRAILATIGPTHSTPGNFNNDLGLPLTLLGMPEGTRFLVAEMGMNHAGEIRVLARLARPDVGLITCIAPVHLEGLGSLQAIAAAKAELLEELPDGAFAVVPADEPLLAPWVERHPSARRLTFGDTATCQVQLLTRQALGPRGSRLRIRVLDSEVVLDLPLCGEHNARNAVAAAAAALAAGADVTAIAAGLEKPPELRHRSALRSLGGYAVLDDCYNASPKSMVAALRTLGELAQQAPRAAVLGAMLELGPDGPPLHREVGREAANAGLTCLITVGELGLEIAKGAAEAGLPDERMHHAASATQAAQLVRSHVPAGAWILVKASRGAKLETVLDHLAASPLGDDVSGCMAPGSSEQPRSTPTTLAEHPPDTRTPSRPVG